MITITVPIYIDGVLTDPPVVALCDPTNNFGIRRLDTYEIVVEEAVEMTQTSTGIYTYTFDEPETDLEYEYYVKYAIGAVTLHVRYTVKGTSSDLSNVPCYTDITEAGVYFAGRIITDAWDNANDLKKQKALITATRAIERLNFYGDKTDPAQDLEFPRNQETDIPQDIIYACCEIAYALLDGVETEKEFEALFLNSTGYGSLRTSYDRTSSPEHIIAGIPSVIAWRYLRPYLREYTSIVLNRT